MKILFLLLLASLSYANGPKYAFTDPKLNDELENVYHDIHNATVSISSLTTTIGGMGSTTNYVTLTGNQSIAGVKTFTGQLIGKGTATNDNPSAGDIGEVISSAVGNVNAPSSGQVGDITSITITAGDWLISGNTTWNRNTATWTYVLLGISATSGNSFTGLSGGDNMQEDSFASTSTAILQVTQAIVPKRYSAGGTSTIYLKFYAEYSAGTPRVNGGRITAVRIR